MLDTMILSYGKGNLPCLLLNSEAVVDVVSKTSFSSDPSHPNGVIFELIMR